MKNKHLTNQTLVYQAKDGEIDVKSNMQKMHISVVSKMETTTPRQVIVSNARFINWSVQKMHIPTFSILKAVKKRKTQ